MSVPVPRLKIVTERRQRPFVAGLIACVVGLVITIVGALIIAGNQALQVVAATDRAEVPNPVTFDAEDRAYSIVLLPTTIGIPFKVSPELHLDCTVVHPDGATEEVDSSSRFIRPETSTGELVGSFEGRGGTTTVTCQWDDGVASSGYFYAVAPSRETLTIVGLVLALGGIVVILVGVVLVIIGVRGRPVRVHTPAP